MTRFIAAVEDGAGGRVLRLPARALEGYKPGERLEIEIGKPRSMRQHRLYWGMLRNAIAAGGPWETENEAHAWVKIRLGLVEWFDIRGRRVCALKSISLRAMSGRRFRTFFDDAARLLAAELGVDPLDFRRNLTD